MKMYIYTHIFIHIAELRAIISIVEYALCLMSYALCLMPVTAELRAIISIVECEDDFPPDEALASYPFRFFSFFFFCRVG